ncbi:MAG: ATP-binding protein [Pseudomonadota bacterium]
MSALRKLFGSIVVQVMAITVFAMIFSFVLYWVLIQTPLADRYHAQALTQNANSIAELAWLVETAPEEMLPFILSAYEGAGRVAVVTAEFPTNARSRPDLQKRISDTNDDIVARLLDDQIRFRTLRHSQLRQPAPDDPFFATGSSVSIAASALEIAVPLKDERVLLVRLAPAIVFSGRDAAPFLPIIVMSLFAIALSFALGAVTLGPIRRLERDAEKIGLAENGPHVSEKGPVELRRIARALNRMRSRLHGLILEREQIISAIAHDIRTNLTKLRLRMVDKDTVSLSTIEGDLQQMETLISDMLAYSRAENPESHRELINIQKFVEQLVRESPIEIGLDTKQSDAAFTIAGDPVALRRLFENLIENARRYGNGEIQIALSKSTEGIDVSVLDNGPGIPQEKIETMFAPFQRLERSRNRATGGTGLGLGIARSIARAHGAVLSLQNRKDGGLIANVAFPIELGT